MASFKVLFVLFVTLFAMAFAANEEVQREKKQIYSSAIPVMNAYPYAYSNLGAYPYARVAPAMIPAVHYY